MSNLGLTKPKDNALSSLKYGARERVPLKKGEVEIAVAATGINFRDVLVVLGMYPGDVSVLGLECSGIVSKVGEGCKNLKVGQPVVAMVHDCFQSYVNCDENFVFPIPSTKDLISAATIPVVYMTAYYGLVHLANIKSSDCVLIHAGAGGVGMAALTLAKSIGARCFSTVSSEEKRKITLARGAEQNFNSRKADFSSEILRLTSGRGVDIILNSLIGEFIDESLKCIKPGGYFLEIGKRDIRSVEDINSLQKVNYIPYDIDAFMINEPEKASIMMSQVIQKYFNRVFIPLPYHEFTYEKTSEAFRFMAQSKHIGKVIITSPIYSEITKPQSKIRSMIQEIQNLSDEQVILELQNFNNKI